MAEEQENIAIEKTIKKSEKQNTAKIELARKMFVSFFKNSFSFFVYFFCFILFPVFLLHSSLTMYFETNSENFRQIKLAQMSEAMEYMEKYSNNKRYFHYILSKISECAQNTDNPVEYLKININNLKEKYPNKFQFVVWDNNGKVIKELCDKSGYSYVLNKLYETLYQVSKDLKKDISTRVSNLEIVKKNMNIFRTFLGRIFIPENLKFPLYNNLTSGPFLTELGEDLSFVWYSINDKISFLCFISNELINDFTGLNKVTNKLTQNSSDIIYGFSIIPDFDKPVSSFPVKYENILSLALTTFENAGDSIFENEKAIVKMSMPQPSIRIFSYMQKTDENWNFEYKRDLWFGIIISVLLAIYSLGGFWFLYKKHFFSIRWKLTALFLLANLAPIAVLGFIAKGFLDSKRLSLKNEIVGELEKSLREFDARYSSLLESYTSRLNTAVQDISNKIGEDTIQQSEINSINDLFESYNASDIYLVASSGRIIFNKRDESKASQKLEFMGSLAESILAFANKKTLTSKHKDVFSNMFNPEDAEMIRIYLKNIGSVVEFKFGDYFRIFYSYTFGDKLGFNHNYILIIFWEKEVFQNIFIRENFMTLSNISPDTHYYIKSNSSNYFYGTEKTHENVNSILDQNLGMTEKNNGYINIDNKKMVFVSLKGTSLKDWTLLAVTPEEGINREINLIVVKTVVGALISLLLTMLIGHLLSLQFLKPIKNLGEAALAIGDRNFSYRVPIGDKDEFGHLNQVFNRVIEGLGDFEVARIVQESLFPGNHFDVGKFRIFGRSVVMTTLGGDYYDCFKINDEYQGIIIGDVAGHGIPAGLMMAMAKSSVLTASEEIKLDPAALTSRLHKMFFAIKNDKLKRMMTFQYFVLRVSDGHFKYTNAGHCFPVIVDGNNKTATFMDYIATPLGIGPRCRCKNQEFDLLENQSLVLYTDGIVEANNAEGEQYGYDRYQACLPEHYDPDPKVFYYNLYNKVYKKWSPKPDDDLTLILVNREQNER